MSIHYREPEIIDIEEKCRFPLYQIMWLDFLQKIRQNTDVVMITRHHRTGSVSVADMKRLWLENGWMNDIIINTYMALLQDRNSNRLGRRNHPDWCNTLFMNTYFFTLLDQPRGYDRVKQWTRHTKVCEMIRQENNVL